MKTCFSDWCSLEPYDWQIDVAKALLLGLDSIIIAGTGSGKTIPFMLPVLIHPEKMIITLSPLKVLQRDQVKSSYTLRLQIVYYVSTGATVQEKQNSCSRCEWGDMVSVSGKGKNNRFIDFL